MAISAEWKDAEKGKKKADQKHLLRKTRPCWGPKNKREGGNLAFKTKLRNG